MSGFEKDADPTVTIVPDDLRALRIYVTLPRESVAGLNGGVTDFNFIVTDLADGSTVRNDTTFRSPAR